MLQSPITGASAQSPEETTILPVAPHQHSRKTSRAAIFAAATLILVGAVSSVAAQGRSTIRDAEIEGLLRAYANPLFQAAGLSPNIIDVVIIKSSAINAFVADGQRMFIHSGMISESETPNEVIGVIAHETGHIAAGHLVRARDEIRKAEITTIITAMLGAAAAVGGSLSRDTDLTTAGAAIMQSSPGVGMKGFLKYARAQEAAADQAAVRYLESTKQSAKGMLNVFQRLGDQMLVSVRNIDPYAISHPLPRERIALLERLAKRSRYFNTPDSDEMQLRHDLARAKLVAFLGRPGTVSRRYKFADDSLPARYARAIASYRSSDMGRAIQEIDALIKSWPSYPYFWELKGQALLEAGRAREALVPLSKSVNLARNEPLLRILYAQALLQTGETSNVDPAIKQLRFALQFERRSSFAYKQLAYAYQLKGDTPRAQFYTAHEMLIGGNLNRAIVFAKRAKDGLKRGSPEWNIANDIVNLKPN